MKKPLHHSVRSKIPAPDPRRIIGDLGKHGSGPLAVFVGGIHGNEPAGVAALEQIVAELGGIEDRLLGRVVAIRGNVAALSEGKRFLDEDLNRLWTKSTIQRIRHKPVLLEEERELLDLLGVFESIIKEHQGPVYFFDLHTTSGKSPPFMTINDVLINRKFAAQIPVPIILGIEEFLDGPMLSYVNDLGYVALGFEGGQHTDAQSIGRCKAFSYLAIVLAGILEKEEMPSLQDNLKTLGGNLDRKPPFFEILELRKIQSWESFQMLPGFESFQFVKKNTPVCIHQGKRVTFPRDAHIFMPLYQHQGKEGFFVIRSIPGFWLILSAYLRRFKMDNLLVLLPGVNWESQKKEILRADLRIAKFLSKPLFHLLGYRLRQVDGSTIRLYNRERAAKRKMYKQSPWR